MADEAGFFREYGIVPTDLRPPEGVVRSEMPWWHVLAQYAATAFVLAGGAATAAGFVYFYPPNFGVPCAAGSAAVALGLVYLVCRHDVLWVELDGDTIRAKHLYTRRVWERSVEEVADLLTLTYPWRTVEAGLGRCRGVRIRFRDGRRPMSVLRADAPMRRSRELIEAVLYRMTERGPLEVELMTRDGRPMVRRIFWAADADGEATTGRCDR